MTVGRDPEIEEGVTIHGETLDIIDWLQYCFEKLEAGAENEIMNDPFYTPRTDFLSDEKIDEVIVELDKKLDYEIDNSLDYHRARSGADAKTEFHRLGQQARRYLVEGLMRIIDEWDEYREKSGVTTIDNWAIEFVDLC